MSSNCLFMVLIIFFFSCMAFNVFKFFNSAPQWKAFFPEILFFVAKFCVRMTSSVKNNEVSPFWCWKDQFC